MTVERVSATRTVEASAAAVFAVLADPSRHAGIDGTGWVTASVDAALLVRRGQLFRMSMFHPDHPDGGYETVNEVTVLEPDRAIAWRTGYVDEATGQPAFGGWWWGYDLADAGADLVGTRVTLSYDWSAVGAEVREYLTFPPFPDRHLDDSLRHLAALVG